MKQCTLCREEKTESEFYRDKGRKDGLTNQCKLCRCQQVKHNRMRRRHHVDVERDTNAPDAVYVLRGCMCCREKFETANDYRMCPTCRSGNAARGYNHQQQRTGKRIIPIFEVGFDIK